MAHYLIDTNILSYLADTASPFHRPVHDRLAALADEDGVALSILSLYEIHHWFTYRPAQRTAADAIIGHFVVLPLPAAGAPRFGALMHDLRTSARRRDLQRAAIRLHDRSQRHRTWGGTRLQRHAVSAARPARPGAPRGELDGRLTHSARDRGQLTPWRCG